MLLVLLSMTCFHIILSYHTLLIHNLYIYVYILPTSNSSNLGRNTKFSLNSVI